MCVRPHVWIHKQPEAREEVNNPDASPEGSPLPLPPPLSLQSHSHSLLNPVSATDASLHYKASGGFEPAQILELSSLN